jgi:hypothetical protein
MTEKSIIGLKNNSDDSTEESVEENLVNTTKTKQKRSVGKKYYEKTYISLELAKKDIQGTLDITSKLGGSNRRSLYRNS